MKNLLGVLLSVVHKVLLRVFGISESTNLSFDIRVFTVYLIHRGEYSARLIFCGEISAVKYLSVNFRAENYLATKILS